MILPTDLCGTTFTVGVLCKDGSIYQYTSPQIGKKYVKGMRYTAILGGNNWVKVSDKEGEVPALSVYNDTTQAAAGFDSGTGTKEDPFIIADASQLKYLQEQVNTAPKPTWNNKDHYIRLDTDIKIAGNWVPIGVEGEHYFEANFDGNGHTIYGNLKDVNNTYANYGFFGYVEYESISNMHLVGNVKGTRLVGNSSSNSSTYNTTGGIVGTMTVGSTSQCTPADIVLSNSTNRGTVTGGIPVATNINYIGGLVGGNSSMLHSCLNAVSATVSTGSGAAAENQTYTGGLVGYNTTDALVYSCCTNQATVNGAAATGNNRVGSVPVRFR